MTSTLRWCNAFCSTAREGNVFSGICLSTNEPHGDSVTAHCTHIIISVKRNSFYHIICEYAHDQIYVKFLRSVQHSVFCRDSQHSKNLVKVTPTTRQKSIKPGTFVEPTRTIEGYHNFTTNKLFAASWWITPPLFKDFWDDISRSEFIYEDNLRCLLWRLLVYDLNRQEFVWLLWKWNCIDSSVKKDSSTSPLGSSEWRVRITKTWILSV